jgi:ribosome-binding protein aMBF1 (putative translation factor)
MTKATTTKKASKQQPPHMGQQIRYARQAAGLTQVELAERLDSKQPLISAWERRAECQITTLQRVANVLGITLVQLLEAKPPPGAQKRERAGRGERGEPRAT